MGNVTRDKSAPPKPRGFAAMAPELHREIASRGGKAAHALGVAHQFSAEEAAAAGRKGGEVVSRDRAHMAAIGRKGAKSRMELPRGGEDPPTVSPDDGC